MMAAVSAASAGSAVCLLEKNEKPGKKIYITGKGRCNFTNAAPMEDYQTAVKKNPRFLHSAFAAFTNTDMMAFVEENGVPVKVERGNRAFPVSDHASDITKALMHAMKETGVEVRLHTEVGCVLFEPYDDILQTDSTIDTDSAIEEIQTDTADDYARQKRRNRLNGRRKVQGVRLTSGEEISADAVIVATGGLSYPATGSTGDGYRFAEDANLRIAACHPSLVPLETAEDYVKDLQGLALKNVTLSIWSAKKKKPVFSEFGEMLFTHFGISGPLVLTASSEIYPYLSKEGSLAAAIDLKPALSEEEIRDRILREINAGPKKEMKSLYRSLLPGKLADVFETIAEIPSDQTISDLTKGQRARLISLLKAFPLTITGYRDYNEAVVTSGGVDCRDVNPSTMEAKDVSGLYFAGEVLDCDAVTGGFNLQIAWSTGYLAGKSAAESG